MPIVNEMAEFRRVELRDVPLCARILRRAWAAHGGNLSWSYCILSCVLRSHWLSERSSTVVGISMLSRRQARRARQSGFVLPMPAIVIYDFATLSRDHGAASSLLAKSDLRNEVEGMMLPVLARTRRSADNLISVYTRHGFTQIPCNKFSSRVWLILQVL